MRLIAAITLMLSAILFAAPVDKPGNYPLRTEKYDFIDTSLNYISFPEGSATFEPLFKKLDTLVFENRGQVKILHIGGSHLQADVISGRIREHFIKEYPGASAGRGFVFPFSAAKTNTPSSYASKYQGIWDRSMNIMREVTKPLGLMGIAVSTSDPRAEITLLLNRYNKNPIWNETRIRLFGFSDSSDVTPVLRVDSMDVEGVLDTASKSYLFTPPHPIDTVQIAFRWADSTFQATIAEFITDSLYQDSVTRVQDSLAALADSLKSSSSSRNGAASSSSMAKAAEKKEVLPETANVALDSMFQGECDVLDTLCLAAEEKKLHEMEQRTADSLSRDSILTKTRPRFTISAILTEADAPGITYSNIGINGARVPSYFEDKCPNLENELKFFNPDLVIFAIGINDANTDNFDGKIFEKNYDVLISRIKKVNPNVAMIFETNNDMYRKIKKRYVQHPAGNDARDAFFRLAKKHKAGVWDKFWIMGGLGSMSAWEKADLAKKDKVHFNLAGYNLLGDMFFKAFLGAYQMHIAMLPALDPAEVEKKSEAPADSANTVQDSAKGAQAKPAPAAPIPAPAAPAPAAPTPKAPADSAAKR